MASETLPFSRDFPDPPAVRGFLHRPSAESGDALVLTHGAGGNSRAPLLAALAREFAESGITVLRCDLPYRQLRAKGPPYPATASLDREGLRRAVVAIRDLVKGRVYLGGQSYGGRQATMLAAEDPGLTDALLLLSYPLHPPGRPTKLRTEHFPQMSTAALFVHGSRDSFGSLEDLRNALTLIPARSALVEIEGGGHGLVRKSAGTAAFDDIAVLAHKAFLDFLGEAATT